MPNLFKIFYSIFKSSGKQISSSNKRNKDFKEAKELSKYDQSIARISKSHSDMVNESIEMVSEYKEMAELNAKGIALEKTGKIDEAISVYEKMLSDEVDTPHTYRRLAIIYSKRKEREEELRVLCAAINNIPTTNASHHQWFADRFNKKSSQNTIS